LKFNEQGFRFIPIVAGQKSSVNIGSVYKTGVSLCNSVSFLAKRRSEKPLFTICTIKAKYGKIIETPKFLKSFCFQLLA